jgi:hypothetical protein
MTWVSVRWTKRNRAARQRTLAIFCRPHELN